MTIPNHLYKPLSEKVPQGDLLIQVKEILGEQSLKGISDLDAIPSLKDVLIPQELFSNLSLTANPCKCQHLTSKGMIKKGKVVFFDNTQLQVVVPEECKDSTVKTCLLLLTLDAIDYCILGNILYKAKQRGN